MNELIVKQTLDSREVAEMMGIEHYKLLRKIEGSTDRKGYIQIINESHLGVVEYFVQSTYKDAKGEERKNYQVTKKGCELIAHKITGEKGVMFTLKYIEKFHVMEEQLQKTTIELQVLKVKELENQVKKLEEVNKELEKSTQEAKTMMKLSHKNKLDFNRMIKSVVANKEEEKTLKAWVLAVNNAAQWQDIPVCKYQKVAQDILNIAPLVSTKTFEQLKLF